MNFEEVALAEEIRQIPKSSKHVTHHASVFCSGREVTHQAEKVRKDTSKQNKRLTKQSHKHFSLIDSRRVQELYSGQCCVGKKKLLTNTLEAD